MTVQRISFKTIAVLLFLACMMCFPGCRKRAGGAESSHAHSQWTTDFEKARQVAKDSDKDLLVNFAGSDWCYWCKKLDAEVFSKAAFVSEAEKQFILVLIDNPTDKSGQSQTVQEQNKRLADEYKIQGYPTVLLMDAEGKTYAQTGYQEGGPGIYLEHLRELRQQKPSS